MLASTCTCSRCVHASAPAPQTGRKSRLVAHAAGPSERGASQPATDHSRIHGSTYQHAAASSRCQSVRMQQCHRSAPGSASSSALALRAPRATNLAPFPTWTFRPQETPRAHRLACCAKWHQPLACSRAQSSHVVRASSIHLQRCFLQH